MTKIENIENLEEALNYFYDRLNWPISQDTPYINAYDANWEYYPDDLGLKDSDFAKITTLQQMKPLKENQDWAVFFVEFDYKHMQITVLRKILGSLIFNKRGTDHKIWNMENLLFVCFWGDKLNRTIGFVHFNQSVKGLPTLKALYFEPKSESKEKLAQYENYLSHLKWEYCEKCDAWTMEWKKAFQTEYGQIIRDTSRLTKELAYSAQTIRRQILDVLAVENEKGYVHELLKKFKERLVHDMDENSFADMYAQTICYGLFSARCLNAGEKIFDPVKAIDSIPDTNPFLRQLLKESFDNQNGNVKKSISFDELELNNIIELLQNTDIQSIVKEFNRQTRQGFEDPVIHFYEDFLTEYDKEAKIDRGVFYTPLPVVNFIVRAVDQILKSEFAIEAGIACSETYPVVDGKGKNQTVHNIHKVQILDPATGTGTFLRQTILKIKENFDQKHKNLSNEDLAKEWNKYVILSLLHRLYGFELMMAPYAVAHMKLAMALKDTGYNFASTSRLKVFLTNSLEEAGDSSGMQSLFEEDAIAQEAMSANKVKKEAQINVVIGNPPYSVSSSNKSKWIIDLTADYKKDLNEKNIQPLSDDYIKFIRLGEHYVAKQNCGVLAYISNNSFIDGLIHRQMRKHLLETFDDIYILNLHGNSKKKESAPDGSKDENVFNIQQGVSINIFVRKKSEEKDKKENAKVHYADLWGERKAKFEFLAKNDFASVNWQDVEYTEPRFYFVPMNLSTADEYEQGFKIDKLMPVYTSGIKTSHDKELISISPFETKDNRTYAYRPFDEQFIDYNLKKVVRPRYEVMKHLLKENIAILACKQAATEKFGYFVTDKICDINFTGVAGQYGAGLVFPLYLYDEDYGTCQPNLNEEIVAKIEKIVKEKIEPLALLDYIYAVLHLPSYRAKYKEFLKIDFPRIPFPKDKEQFASLSALGSKLRCLHLMKAPELSESAVLGSCALFNADGSAVSSSSDIVMQRKYDYDGQSGKVWINKTQYFASVDESTWAFYIGGYQVADKWLKDRKGRALSGEDILHYSRIIAVLKATEQIMHEIDAVFSV